jgi:hypothetical protein
MHKTIKAIETSLASNTTTLNSFEKNYKGLMTGLELGFERSFNFVEIRKHPKILGFHF